MASSWEAVLGDVASVMQILGVDVVALILLDKLLCLSSCKAECAKLKERVAELEALLINHSAGVDPHHVHSVIDDANGAVDAYNGNSVLRVMWSSRRMQRDMVQQRRRVKLCVSGLIAANWATQP